jgi:cyclopropane fatty-acyl-phospholipid synthase-like methyltransferase
MGASVMAQFYSEKPGGHPCLRLLMDPKLSSPSAARNREPILAVLRRVLSAEARVLELASGSGEHAVYFAAAMPGWDWTPSDPDPDARASIAAWAVAEGLANLQTPRAIDVGAEDWGLGPDARYDALVCINMIHISPWEATLGLMRGAGRWLRAGGLLYTYGAYKQGGRHSAPSNESFDAWLKARDPRFGVRELEAVEAAARAQGLALVESIEMPANNLSLLFSRNA